MKSPHQNIRHLCSPNLIIMKRIFLLLIATLFSMGAMFAQSGELLIRSSSKGLYLEHTVSPRENFYSIGRLYNVKPKELAAFNGLDMTKGLNIGQALQIPLTRDNFIQTGNKGAPVYYTVGDKEALRKVSANNNKVALENLRKWNGLSSDDVSTGSNLVVGFLVGSEIKTTLAKVDPKKEEKKKKKEEKNKGTIDEKQPEMIVTRPEKKTEPQEVKRVETARENQMGPSDAGYFRTYFEQQIKTYPVTKDQTVTSGIFKTASGWQDGKYYALMDKIEPGTIIKIINPINNKTIYAKVLGEMSGIRQNLGLNIRISNAAASALEISETDKFIVKVNY